jgi:membrane protease YdiL (CAAX protease family)
MNDSTKRDWHEVNGWHVLFLFFVIWTGASLFTHYQVPQSLDPVTRWNYRAIIAQTVTAVLFSTLVLLNRNLRNFAFAACRRPARPIVWVEIGAAVCVMFLWAFGAHRVIVGATLVYGDSSFWYRFFGLANSAEVLREKHLLLAILIGVIVAPILEEFVFRAVMLRAWLQKQSVWLSIALSSIAFGAIHNVGFLFAAGGGVLFAVLYLSYGSIWPVVLVHAIHNVIALTPAMRERAFLRDPATVSNWSSWSVEIILAGMFFPLAVWLFRRLVASPIFPRTPVLRPTAE